VEGILSPALHGMALAALALVPGLFFLLWFRWRRNGDTPISDDNLRVPGDYLRGKIARIDDRVNELLILIFLAPAAAAGVLLGASLARGVVPVRSNYLQLAVILVVFLSIPLLSFSRRLRERVRLLQGLDAELAVGLELNKLAGEGFHIYHDFPAGRNNIDHVLVGPSGIYAVETKGRPKPDKDRVVLDAKVIYDGEALFFPDNAKETAAIDRSRQQAAALSQWLSDDLGEAVAVRPALALPGWFVERRKPDELLILYGQSNHYARLLKGAEVLGEAMLKRIVDRLEIRNRGLEIAPGKGSKLQSRG